MTVEDYINENHSCPECQKFGLTEQELIDHTWHGNCASESPFEEFFPKYYVCGKEADVDNHTACYLKIESETGPFYMAWESRDYVEQTYANELLRHEWESVAREETPFPRFEDQE